MDSLLTLIESYVTAHAAFAMQDEADTSSAAEDVHAEMVIARHALELRLAELTGHLEGMNMAGTPLSRPLLLLQGDQPT